MPKKKQNFHVKKNVVDYPVKRNFQIEQIFRESQAFLPWETKDCMLAWAKHSEVSEQILDDERNSRAEPHSPSSIKIPLDIE